MTTIINPIRYIYTYINKYIYIYINTHINNYNYTYNYNTDNSNYIYIDRYIYKEYIYILVGGFNPSEK